MGGHGGVLIGYVGTPIEGVECVCVVVEVGGRGGVRT